MPVKRSSIQVKKSGAARTAAEVQAETDLSTESSSIDDSPVDDSSADDSSAPIYLEPHENTLLSDLKCLLIDVGNLIRLKI